MRSVILIGGSNRVWGTMEREPIFGEYGNKIKGRKRGKQIIKRGTNKENVWGHRAILEGKKGPPPPWETLM